MTMEQYCIREIPPAGCMTALMEGGCLHIAPYDKDADFDKLENESAIKRGLHKYLEFQLSQTTTGLTKL